MYIYMCVYIYIYMKVNNKNMENTQFKYSKLLNLHSL